MRSTVLPSLLVVGLRPERLLTRGVGEFVKGLAQELGASQPPMHPAHLAAALGDRRISEPQRRCRSGHAPNRRRSPDAGPGLTSTWAGCQRGRDPDAGQRVSPAPTRAGLSPRSPRSVARPAAPAPSRPKPPLGLGPESAGGPG